MEQQIPIENLVLLRAATAQARAAALEAVLAALGEVQSVVQVRSGQGEKEAWVRFHCDWEPPFRAVKKTSGVHAEVTFILLSESFAKSHWISRAEYVAGKGEELTLSRVDDEFDGPFGEIFGKSLAAWEAAPSVPFPSHA